MRRLFVAMLALAGMVLSAFHFNGIIRQDLQSAVNEMQEGAWREFMI